MLSAFIAIIDQPRSKTKALQCQSNTNFEKYIVKGNELQYKTKQFQRL